MDNEQYQTDKMERKKREAEPRQQPGLEAEPRQQTGEGAEPRQHPSEEAESRQQPGQEAEPRQQPIEEAQPRQLSVEGPEPRQHPGQEVEPRQQTHEEAGPEEETHEVREKGLWGPAEAEEEGEDLHVLQPECKVHVEEEQFVTEDEDAEPALQRYDCESSEAENVYTDPDTGQLFTLDTEAPNTSDADVPPSYSKAVSFDHLSVSSDESDCDRHLMVMTPDSRSDLDDPLLPSTTTELTASELLLNKSVFRCLIVLSYII